MRLSFLPPFIHLPCARCKWAARPHRASQRRTIPPRLAMPAPSMLARHQNHIEAWTSEAPRPIDSPGSPLAVQDLADRHQAGNEIISTLLGEPGNPREFPRSAARPWIGNHCRVSYRCPVKTSSRIGGGSRAEAPSRRMRDRGNTESGVNEFPGHEQPPMPRIQQTAGDAGLSRANGAGTGLATR